MFSALMSSMFAKKERPAPQAPVPSVKTDLRTLNPGRDTVVWLGHSSFFLLLGGNSILVDPVFSDYAAPFSSFNKAFAGTNVYTADDMPDIDYLLITHDHWDHLDHPTVTALQPRVSLVVCGLGGVRTSRTGDIHRKKSMKATGTMLFRFAVVSQSIYCPPAIFQAAFWSATKRCGQLSLW